MSDAYLKLTTTRKAAYKTWSPIFCKAINNYVYFGMGGFNHLRFKTDNSPRNTTEAMYKLGLLPLVRPVLYTAKQVTAHEKRLSPVGGSKTKTLKLFEFWAVTEIVGKQQTKIKVILRKPVGSNRVQFWSVMKLTKKKHKKA